MGVDARQYYERIGPACDKRRRRAALLDDVEATPVIFHEIPPGPVGGNGRSLRLMRELGSLPMNLEEAIIRINLGPADKGGGKGLKSDDVYIHYIEAANSNFIGDRFMFLGDSTLRNIATHAEGGFSFMNSHRTGGLSSPSELPFGRTFAGRYEEFEGEDGATYKRSVVGIYMLRGVYPNGENGPSTDDLHRSIDSGTLSDVSMGLVYGSRVCDVCTQDLTAQDEDGKYLCPHAPGTHRKMSEDERKSQEARGVRGGRASYSLVDAMPQEVSAVYKGAVPGAGFRKARQFAMAGDFTADEGREVLSAYGSLWARDERSRLFERGSTVGMNWRDAFKFWKAAGEPAQFAIEGLGGVDLDDLAAELREPIRELPPRATLREIGNAKFSVGTVRETSRADEPDPAQVERERLAAERERKAAIREFRADAREYLAPLRASGKISKSEGDKFELSYVLAALDDEANPATDFDGKPVKRVDLLKGSNANRTPHPFMTGEGQIGDESTSLRPGEKPLSNEPEAPPVGPDDFRPTQEEKFRLHAMSPTGRAYLQSFDEGREYLRKHGKL